MLWSGLTIEIHWAEGVPHLEVPHELLPWFMAGSIALVAVLSRRMGAVSEETLPVEWLWRPVVYLGWLVKEIVLSNLHIARVILSRDLPIRPKLVEVTTTQQTDLGHVIHANSITITPGTVSLDVRDGVILVHALTQDTAEGVQSGNMDSWVTWLEGTDG